MWAWLLAWPTTQDIPVNKSSTLRKHFLTLFPSFSLSICIFSLFLAPYLPFYIHIPPPPPFFLICILTGSTAPYPGSDRRWLAICRWSAHIHRYVATWTAEILARARHRDWHLDHLQEWDKHHYVKKKDVFVFDSPRKRHIGHTRKLFSCDCFASGL